METIGFEGGVANDESQEIDVPTIGTIEAEIFDMSLLDTAKSPKNTVTRVEVIRVLYDIVNVFTSVTRNRW